MIFEVVTTSLMGCLAAKAFLSRKGEGNDSQKLNKIFTLTGLNVKHGSETFTAQLVKKRNFEWGSEYRYRIPLGRSFEDYLSKQKTIEAGLNSKSSKLDLSPLRSIELNRDIFKNIKDIATPKLADKKEVELSFDGMLSVKVYNSPMPSKVEWKESMLNTGSWKVLIGVNRSESFHHDFDDKKSIIIAGVPGSGKSVVIKLIITSLILQNPDNVTFSLIDLKEGAAFTRFKDTKQVINFGPDQTSAVEILRKIKDKMNEDYKKIVRDGYEDVKEAKVKKRHFIIIDEAADLADNKEAMELITDIVRKGRGSGYYVIYSTQYPSMQAVSSQIKRNIPVRLSFVLDSKTASITVLDTAGAEELPDIPGRGLYKSTKTKLIQTPYMSNKLIDQLIEPHKGGPKIEEVVPEARKHTAIIEETGLSES